MDDRLQDKFGNYTEPETETDQPNDHEMDLQSHQGSDSDHEDKDLPKTYLKSEFLVDIMSNPTLVRNVALVGHLEHGKTVFMDMLVKQSHQITTSDQNREKCMRYNDTWVDKRGRKMSIKAVPMSLILEDSNSKLYMCNIMDTPGHVDFSDEMTAALRLVDGVVLILDAAEGVRMNTARAIQHAIRDHLTIVVVINKVDRLITELKLPPEEAYQILARTVETINNHITAVSATDEYVQVINPANGNLCFASGGGGWCFTLHSFAKLYVKFLGTPFDAHEFASKLWGDHFYDTATATFKQLLPSNGVKRSFVQLILEPLYEIYSQVDGKHKKGSETTHGELRLACNSFFRSATSFTDMLVRHIPSAKEAATPKKLEYIFSGPKDNRIYIAMEECDPSGPLMVNITKLYPNLDCSGFDALGRVYSGEISNGELVRVLIEGCSSDEADMTVKEVTKLWIYQAGERISINNAYPGSLVVIEGVDDSIMKSATLCELEYYEQIYIFRPLQFNTIAVMKNIIRSLDPYDGMVNCLVKIRKSYPLAIDFFEAYELQAISGTGELYLDSIMRDIRELYSKVEVKLSRPVVQFCETVGSSSMKFSAETRDKKNKITMIAEPLETGMAEDIENSAVSVDGPRKKPGNILQTKFDWDLLAAKSIWAFGPGKQGPNILLDDTLSSDVDKNRLNVVKDFIVDGFQRGANKGPLCHEPIRNVKFRIVDARITPNPLDHEILTTAKHLTHSTFLGATPRLMEPVYYMEIQTRKPWASVVRAMLSGKRSIIIQDDVPQLETGDCILKAFVPMIEIIAFDKELQNLTAGQAFSLSTFDHWAIVPGDPLDKGTESRPLESAPNHNCAHEYVVETRRMKHLSPSTGNISNLLF